VWHLRWKWAEIKPQLQVDLLAGDYRFKAVDRFRGAERVTDLWSARDALVLKAMTIVLQAHLEPHLSDRCYHLAGHDGTKATVTAVAEKLADHNFVCRTDVAERVNNILKLEYGLDDTTASSFEALPQRNRLEE
jgi:hypothetical protein